MLRLIDRLVLKDLVGPFLSGLAMFLVLIFAAAYLFPATELVVKGVALPTVVRLMVFSLPGIVTQTFPMAMLLAGLMAFGRLSGDKEAVAIFAAGVSFLRMSRAVWIMGAAVSLLAFVWNETLVPYTSTVYWDLRQEATRNILKSNRPLSYNVENSEDGSVKQFVTIDGGFDAKDQTLRRVCIIVYSQNEGQRGQPEVIIYCDRARAYDEKGLRWKYYDGYFMLYNPDKQSGKLSDFVTINFRELETLPKGATIGKTFDEVLSSNVNDPNRRSFRDLQKEIAADQAKGNDVKGKEVDLYGKIALPLASLIFGILGAALGLNTQRGANRAVGFGLAVMIVFLYWIFYHSMFVIGKGGSVPPMLASFLADIVGAVVGVFLVRRASR